MGSRLKPRWLRRAYRDASRRERLTALIFVGLFAAIGVYSLLFSKAEVAGMKLYLTPSSQTIAAGQNLVVAVTIDTAGAPVNTVQSVLTYSSADFTLVSITPGAAFASAFPNTASTGTIQFTAASATPVSGVQTVATVTLQATGAGTSPINLAGVCPNGSFAVTCSAAYDSTTSANDLSTIATPITGGSYTVTPILPAAPTNLTSSNITTNSVSLAWTASTDTGGPGLTGYHVYRNGTLAGSIGTTSYTDSGLNSGTNYTYTITAYDKTNNASPPSQPLQVMTLSRHVTKKKH